MKHGMKTLMQQLAITSLILIGSIFSNASASEENYEDMTLDQLVEVNIFASSVLSAHIHQQGEFMFSVDAASMRMDGLRDGTHKLSTGEVLQDFMITPIWMTMEMQMLHLMYAPSDDVTIMLMIMHIEKEMKHPKMHNQLTIASIYAGLYKEEDAILFLEKAVQSGFLDYKMLEVNPVFESIQHLDSFKKIKNEIQTKAEEIQKEVIEG